MVGVTCEKCGATYRFDDADVPPSGKIIKCARCQSSVTVMPAGAAAMGMKTPPGPGIVPQPGGGAKKGGGLVPPPAAAGKPAAAARTEESGAFSLDEDDLISIGETTGAGYASVKIGRASC